MPIHLGNGVQMYTRSEWGALSPRLRAPFSAPIGSTIHWEGVTLGTYPHSTCARKVRGIQSFHMRSVSQGGRGWSDIAYNFLVCPHGRVFEGRGLKVKSGANGTTLGNNSSYAICALWGPRDTITREAAAAIHVLAVYCRRHGAGARVNGHRDWKSTACPGDALYQKVLTKVWERNFVGSVPESIGDLFMSLSNAEQLEMRDKIRDLHRVMFDGVPSFGVPPVVHSVTMTNYSVSGVDLQNQPKSLRTHITDMRSTMMVSLRGLFQVLGVTDKDGPPRYEASKDQSRTDN